MVILVDMDDTIEHLLPAWLFFLNNKYGFSVQPDSIRSWNMSEAYPTLTPTQVYEPLFLNEFWDTVKPIEGAAEYLRKMIDDGHEVYIVTASNPNTLKAKMDKVLFKNFPFIDWNHVIVTSRKQLVYGDIRIDDAPHNLVDTNGLQILMDAPHNRDFPAEKCGFVRVKTWPEIYKEVCHYVSWLQECEEYWEARQ